MVIEGSKKPLFEVPTIKEYFLDLDYILGVISDGPTKSFAFRRLKYLSAQWAMYSLLNEYQELADMKVSVIYQVLAALFDAESDLECTASVRLHWHIS